jgi:hypothetical protein
MRGIVMTTRFTGRQLTTMVVALSVAIVAAPVAALAATGSFASSSASVAAVSATNSAAASGAKAVYGNASGTSGTTFGVLGAANSSAGYGVYSAGRLGTTGALVCAHCVDGADINAPTFPRVPDAGKLAGHAPSYYARIAPLSWAGPVGPAENGIAVLGGVIVYASCRASNPGPTAQLAVAAQTDADAGTINYFDVQPIGSTRIGTPNAQAGGQPLTAVPVRVAESIGAIQVEGTATFRRNSDGRVVTISFHLYGATCEVFGNALTTG